MTKDYYFDDDDVDDYEHSTEYDLMAYQNRMEI